MPPLALPRWIDRACDTGEVVWKEKIDDYAAGCSATAAPLIANGLLLTGKIVSEATDIAPLWSGVLATGGHLVFWGTPEGFLQAADAKTGKVVWKFQTGSGIVARPITWEVKGEQYVAVVSGWGGAVPLWGGDVAKKASFLEQGGSVWVFKLVK